MNLYRILLEATKLPLYYYALVVAALIGVYYLGLKKVNAIQRHKVVLGLIFFCLIVFLITFIVGRYEALDLTVYVHGPEGKQQIILENRGKLIIDFDNDRRVAMIGENGRTNFEEIPTRFNRLEVEIGFEEKGYELINPGKKYLINGSAIYIGIKKDNSLGIVSGYVRSEKENRLLQGAEVFIGSDTSILTDNTGFFRILLPQQMRVIDSNTPYRILVRYKGIEKEYRYFPLSGPLQVQL